ncbi:ArsR/SmtB family transcription factor [Alkalisalibacterium limincola]|nr:helix-turn-helix transcriptional regulator [Alkalisalibacterium limincola]
MNSTDSMTEDAALQALSALSQRSRLALFRHLVRHAPVGDCPGEMAVALDLSPPTLSFHLKALVSAGLVEAEPKGRHITYRARLDAIAALVGFLGENCCAASGASCETPARRGAVQARCA